MKSSGASGTENRAALIRALVSEASRSKTSEEHL
jgi:hypothetical protein